jgi:hypothetical protein
MFVRQRTRRQLAISIVTGVTAVSVLALMVGTLGRTELITGTSLMAAAGLLGIWLFDSPRRWSWPSDGSEYLTIVGMIGFWDAISDSVFSWVFAIVFYWGMATLVRRARYAR